MIIESITQAVIDDTFAVNVRGTILMTREFINHRGDYGRIVNLSTDAHCWNYIKSECIDNLYKKLLKRES